MNDKKTVTILVPAYNEAVNLPGLIAALDSLVDGRDCVVGSESVCLADYEWEYLVVDDGSVDDTAEVVKALRADNRRVNCLSLSRNFGKESAMLAGMDYAGGDAVIIMDADAQDPVHVIPEMILWWQRGFDDVYGRRETRGRESWLRKKLSLTFYSILQGATRIDVLENVGDFRLLDRRVVDSIRELRETQRYTKGLYCWVGFRKKEVLFKRHDRREGRSSFNLLRLVNLAVEGITSFTTAPLRISAVIGFVVSFLAIIYLVVIVAKTIFMGEPVQGFPTIMCAILLLGGIQLMALGIIGEYIGRIFNETKNRPPYIADSFNGEKVSRPRVGDKLP